MGTKAAHGGGVGYRTSPGRIEAEETNDREIERPNGRSGHDLLRGCRDETAEAVSWLAGEP